MTSEADFWACRICRSINPRRSGRCYSCHTPREVAGARPTELSVTDRETKPALTATGPYRSSETRAVIVTLLAAGFIVATLASLWLAFQVGEARASGASEDQAAELLGQRLPVFLVATGLGVSALVAYGAWISRVVANLPTLGVGYSRVSPELAFAEPLIPGVNIVSLPARAGEVVRKLEGTSIDLALIVATWFLLIAPPVGGALLLRFGGVVGGAEDVIRMVGLVGLVGFTLQSVGLACGLIVVWRIEALSRVRAGAAVKAPSPAGTAST